MDNKMIYGLSWLVVIWCGVNWLIGDDGISFGLQSVGGLVLIAAVVAIISNWIDKFKKGD